MARPLIEIRRLRLRRALQRRSDAHARSVATQRALRRGSVLAGATGAGPPDKGRMKRILVVDDDDNLRELLATVLSQESRVVDVARDGIEALELLTQNRYDLIISDLRMPGLNGPALYEALRATPQVTPTTRDLHDRQCRTGEYAPFLRGTTEPMLEKPFSLDVVRHMVRVLLNER